MHRVIASNAAKILRKQHGVPACLNQVVARPFHQTQFRRDEEEETPKQVIKVKPAWQGYAKDIKNLFYYPATFMGSLLLGGFIYRYILEESERAHKNPRL